MRIVAVFFIALMWLLPAQAQRYRAEMMPMPMAAGVRVTGARYDTIVGLHYNQYYGVVWKKGSSKVAILPDALIFYAAGEDSVGGMSQQGDATIWVGPNFTPINLHPDEFNGEYDSSEVVDIQGGYQVGVISRGLFGARLDGIIWRGSKHDYTMLTPPGYDRSGVSSIDGDLITGGVSKFVNQRLMSWICIWRDYGARFELFHMFGERAYIEKSRNGVQVGEHYGTDRQRRPCLWRGAIESSFVDLSPPGIRRGQALDTDGEVQVGWVRLLFRPEEGMACLWRGSAATFVNLHDLLPLQFIWSEATGIDANGVIYGTAVAPPRYAPIPVRWVPIR